MAIDPGVMGDLVIAIEGVVDGRQAPQQIGGEDGATGFLHSGCGAGADEGVLQAAGNAREDMCGVAVATPATTRERRRSGKSVRIRVTMYGVRR